LSRWGSNFGKLRVKREPKWHHGIIVEVYIGFI
jgi:hypothetical protein